jgi:hypothetical protein
MQVDVRRRNDAWFFLKLFRSIRSSKQLVERKPLFVEIALLSFGLARSI